MALRPRSASLLVLFLLPVILSVIAISSDSVDTDDLPIRINVEYLLSEKEFRMNEGVFDNRPVMRLQGFEFFIMILEIIGSKNFAIVFLMLIFSVSVFLVYLISLKITQSPTAAWFSVLVAGSSPIFLVNAYSYNEVLLALPIILFSVYLFTQNKINITALIFSFIVLSILNFSGIYLVFILLIYLLVLSTIGAKINKEIKESIVILISILIGILTVFSLLFQDYAKLPVFYNNLPQELLIENLLPLSLLSRLFYPGLIVILFAALGSYYLISRANDRAVLPFSMLIAGVILSLFSSNKLVLAIFGMSASIVASYGISVFLQWISITKAGSYKKTIFLFLGIIIISLGVTQSMFALNEIKSNFADTDELLAYDYIVSLDGDKIFTTLDMSEKAEYYTGKNVYMSDDFTGVYDSNAYFNNYNNILSSRSNIEAISIIQENEIDFLIFRIEDIPFFLSNEVIESMCFEETDFNSIKVYKLICGVRQ